MRAAISVVVIAACSAPAYKFDADAGSTIDAMNRDSGTTPSADAGDSGRAGDLDAAQASDAAPFSPLTVRDTGNFAADCTHIALNEINVKVLTEDKLHCVLFFHGAFWGRSAFEAKTLCSQIAYRDRAGHLASAPTKEKADLIQNNFVSGLATWVGLAVKSAGLPPTVKQNWQWDLGGGSFAEPAYDGWATTPSGNSCVAWAGLSQWADFDCTLRKGVLCEIDEP